MASHAPQQCCTVGVKHEGTATGELKTIGDTEIYFAYPSSKSTDTAIVILTDVLGHKLNNVQLIADQLAANGYFVAVPDLFHGDPLGLGSTDLMTWLKGHPTSRVDPVVEATIKYLKGELGVKKLGSVGYCFGAKYVARFLKKGKLDAGFVAHPSFVDEDEIKGMQGPFSIAAAETDTVFPAEKRHKTEELLRDMDIPWQINLYSDVQHGFAVRADLSQPRAKWAKEQAFFQAVQWFDEYIKKAGAKL